MPRLLVISNHSGSFSSVRPEAEIFLALRRLGFDITLMTPLGGAYVEKAKSAGIRIIDFRAPSKFNIASIQEIRKTVSVHRVDIVHAFNGKALSNAAWALFGLQTKLVGYRGYSGNIFWYDPTCYLHFLHPRVNKMVCLSESVRTMFLKAGMSATKAVTIHKGHDTTWYEHIRPTDLETFGISVDSFTCAFVANNRIRMKGVEHLVRAIHQVAKRMPICVLMVGKGLNDQRILNLISELGIEKNFVFVGYQSDPLGIVKACNFAVSASVFGESTQKSVIEAMYLGKPVIITDIAGNAGMVQDGISGIISKAGSSEDLARAITTMYELGSESRLKMGQKGFQHIRDFLNHERTVLEYQNLYMSLMKSV